MNEITALSIGSNIGDRVANIATALQKLKTILPTLRTSSLYETAPVEYTDQPRFLNCAVVADIDSSRLDTHPEELLDAMLAIERAMGRERTIPKGPRTIDIDLLLYGSRTISTDRLTVPHPAMHERRFVLVPLAEIAPELRHPTLKASVSELLDRLPPATDDAVEWFSEALCF